MINKLTLIFPPHILLQVNWQSTYAFADTAILNIFHCPKDDLFGKPTRDKSWNLEKWFRFTFWPSSDNSERQVERSLPLTHILSMRRVWEFVIIRSTVWVRNGGKLNGPIGMKRGNNTWKTHKHKKRPVCLLKHRQQRSQTESSNKTAKRWTLNELGGGSLWVSPLWGTQHTSWVPSESVQSAAIHLLKAQGQSSTGPQTCDLLSHTAAVRVLLPSHHSVRRTDGHIPPMESDLFEWDLSFYLHKRNTANGGSRRL